MRSQHLREMSLDEEALTEEQKQADQQFVFSTALLASTATCSVFAPPLLLLHLPFLVYLGIPFYKEAWADLSKRHEVTTTVVDATLGMGTIVFTPFTPSVLVLGSLGAVIITFTRKITTRTKDGTRRRLTNLMGEQPRGVWVLVDDIEIEVPFDTIKAGDLVVIQAGQMIPVDGCVAQGAATVDQHLLTGESQPAEKADGDRVFAATVVLAGRIVIRVEKTGEETAAAEIGQMLVQTADFTSSIEVRGKAIANKAALPTLVMGVASLPFVGPKRALSILYSGIGYNMKVLGPLSVLTYLQVAANRGILIKDGRALEQISTVDTVVFDKTGTLTLDQPHVGAVWTCPGFEPDEVLRYAAAAEHRQSHPIALAIRREAAGRGIEAPAMSDAAYEVGYGIKVRVGGRQVRVGSEAFLDMEGLARPGDLAAAAHDAHDQGSSVVYVALDDEVAGAIELQPTIRPEAKAMVDALRRDGIELYVLSGDNERATRSLASQLGIERYFAETPPDRKAAVIGELRRQGRRVCFVGDGINDAIALKTANVSISIRGAATVATDTAQIILMDSTLNQLHTLFTLSHEFEANMHFGLMTTVVPGVAIVGGALLGVISYGASIGLFATGLIVGVVNATSPRFATLGPAAPVALGEAPRLLPAEAAGPADVTDRDQTAESVVTAG